MKLKLEFQKRVALLLLAAFSVAIVIGCAHSMDVRDEALKVEDYPAPAEDEGFVMDTSKDLQYPELPNGCEATALSTLMRMNGIEVSKTEVADAMPKGMDFVNEYWGDPYTTQGWSCMAPCSVYTAGLFGVEAEDMTGTPLRELPLPAAVWVTINMKEPVWSSYELEGYRLAENPHCITVTEVGSEVRALDPLMGWVELDVEEFDGVYQAMGMQAITIKERV